MSGMEYIRQQVNSQLLKLMLSKQEKLDKLKDLSDFNKGLIIMAWPQGQSISKTEGGVFLVFHGQYLPKSGPKKDDQWTGIRVMGA